MRQALHILRKDLRRGWPLLLLWAAILLFWIEPIWRDPLYADELSRIDSFRSGVVVIAAILGVALVVQHDSLIGVREFWMTRPIRRSSLLGAKAAFVGAFLILPPVALQWAVLARYGVPQEHWAAEALELAVPWVNLIAIVSLMAAWTRGLPGFFAFVAGMILVPSFGLGAANLLRGARVSFSLPTGISTAMALGALALLALQYATRRRLIGVLVGAAAAAAVTSGVFRFNPYERLLRANTVDLPEVRVELTPGPGRETFAAERPGSTAGRAMDLWFVPELADDLAGGMLEVDRVEGDIRWDDGATTPFYASRGWHLVAPEDQTDGKWGLLADPAPLWRALGVQGDETFDGLLGRRGALAGAATGAIWRLAETRRLPLRAGAEHTHSSLAIRITGIEREPGEIRIAVRSREIISLRRPYPRMQLKLVHPASSKTIPLSAGNGGSGLSWGTLLSSPPTKVLAKELSYQPPQWAAFWGEGEIDDAWLSGAELEVTFFEFAGRADVSVEARLAVDSGESDAPTLASLWRSPR